MILAPRALTDAEEIYAYISREAPVAAERWIVDIFDLIESLARFPQRSATAPENSVLRVGLRQILFGNYRVLFTIDESSSAVNVLHIRHAARASFGKKDLE